MVSASQAVFAAFSSRIGLPHAWQGGPAAPKLSRSERHVGHLFVGLGAENGRDLKNGVGYNGANGHARSGPEEKPEKTMRWRI
mmetsp:Transcript_41642/g.64987  ORF Transcript_41642/g.64987 Transcript_41642/m.64987 type:complete len:83 (+) Transcript_41642:1599-1847(+)